jgi:hypothetical protein
MWHKTGLGHIQTHFYTELLWVGQEMGVGAHTHVVRERSAHIARVDTKRHATPALAHTTHRALAFL